MPSIYWRAHSCVRIYTVYCITALSRSGRGEGDQLNHKVLTYLEYRAVSGVFQNIDPPPPPYIQPASVSSPRTKGGGVPTRRAVRGWGSIFWKTPDIGLASYSIIPLRSSCSHGSIKKRGDARANRFRCSLIWMLLSLLRKHACRCNLSSESKVVKRGFSCLAHKKKRFYSTLSTEQSKIRW